MRQYKDGQRTSFRAWKPTAGDGAAGSQADNQYRLEVSHHDGRVFAEASREGERKAYSTVTLVLVLPAMAASDKSRAQTMNCGCEMGYNSFFACTPLLWSADLSFVW